MVPTRTPLEIAGRAVTAGTRLDFSIPLARLSSGTEVALPIQIFHGIADGPAVWLSAAIHGDELCGVEIIRRVAAGLDPLQMRGTVIACPIVNVHGFNTGDRYLPDRRDLNRAFPGSARGSLAARIARLFLEQVVAHCSLGIDFHTGTDHRKNLPHLRADLDDAETLQLSEVFAPPIAVSSRLRDGSLRAAATEWGAKVLLFEGGEAMRFDPVAIRVGTSGTRRVLHHLGMIDGPVDGGESTLWSPSSAWSRAPRSGILDLGVELGDRVREADPVGTVHDAFGRPLTTVRARTSGMVIGLRQHPLVNQGDAVAHIAAL